MLFQNVAFGVIGAGTASSALSAALLHLSATDAVRAVAWSAYIWICAFAHLALGRAYKRARPRVAEWRRWAGWFTAISLCEGLGWGWSTIFLVQGDRFDLQLMVLTVGLSIASGSIAAFGSYPPAFAALFLPVTLPYPMLRLAAASDVQRSVGLLMLVFIVAMGAIAVRWAMNFADLVRLRLQMAALVEDLGRQKDVAEAANRAKSLFLASASHDLRQPVHALGLFVGALRGVAMPIEGRRFVEQIEASTAAMDGLFTALLDISRLDAGVVPVRLRTIAVQPLIERICRDHADEAARKSIALVHHHCNAVIRTDPIHLERILRNLVANAVRYTPDGRVVVGCRRRGEHLQIQVLDTGVGIAPDQQERVFQEFYQLDNSERDRVKGIGLGLAIVRRLAALLGSDVELHSTPGRGSRFAVTVPFATGAVEQDDAADEWQGAQIGEGLIVVIDDEADIRDAMSALIRQWGHDVVAAGSGDEAIEMLAECPSLPRLIICDYRLRGGENGIAVIDRLRTEYNEDIPAMLITGDTSPDRIAEAHASGLPMLHKPVSNARLRAVTAHLAGPASANGADLDA